MLSMENIPGLLPTERSEEEWRAFVEETFAAYSQPRQGEPDIAHRKRREEPAAAPRKSSRMEPAMPKSAAMLKAAKPGELPNVFRHTLLAECELPVRMKNYAEKKGVSTVGGLVAVFDELSAGRGIGKGTVEETRAFLIKSSSELLFGESPQAVEALKTLSGSDQFAFDIFGNLCVVPQSSAPQDVAPIKGAADCSDATLFSSVELLDFPEPVFRRLKGNGFATVGDILAEGEEGLLRVRGIGIKKAREIMEAALAFGSVATAIESQDALDLDADPDEEALSAALAAWETLSSRHYELDKEAFDACAPAWVMDGSLKGESRTDSDVIKMVELSPSLSVLCQAQIEQALAALSEEVRAGSEARPVPFDNGSAWLEAAKIVSSKPGLSLDEQARTLSLVIPSLEEWLDSLEGVNASAVKMRFSGFTFKEIAHRMGLSSSWCGQQRFNALFEARPILREDAYRILFEEYAVSLSDFCEVTGEGRRAYSYLKEAYGKPGSVSLKKASYDRRLSERVREGVRRLVDKDFIFIDGERIRKEKDAMVEFLMRRYATNAHISAERLYRKYSALIEEHHLQKVPGVAVKSERSFASYLPRHGSVMCAPAGASGRDAFRYYDFDSKDFSSLKTFVLGLELEDVEISTALIFENPEAKDLMESLDIRDEYELYTVMRILFEDDPRITFVRTPHLKFGDGSKDAQVRSLVEEIGPADANTLAAEYRLRYGVREDTFKANFLKPVESYCNGGRYFINEQGLAQEHRAFLESQLTGVYHEISLVAQRFRAEFPKAPRSLVNARNVASLGYVASDGLFVKKGTDLGKVFAELIRSRPTFGEESEGFGKGVFANSVFKSELDKAVRSLDVLEFEKGKYLNAQRLEALGVTKESLADYLDSALNFMKKGVPYTVKSLRNAGFSHPLDALVEEAGLDDYFFAALICSGATGNQVKRTFCNSHVAFCKMRGSFKFVHLAELVLQDKDALDLDDFCCEFAERFGIEMSDYEMRQRIYNSDLLYDEDLEMVFASTDSFKRKVNEWL